MKAPKSWKDVFNGNKAYYEDSEFSGIKALDWVAKSANEAGYKFFAYKKNVYDIIIPSDYGEMGVDASAGDVVCKVKDLK